MSRMIRVMNWIVALLGLWEFGDIVAPLVPGFGTVHAFVWSHIAAGLVLLIAGARAATTSRVRAAITMDCIAAAAGVWLVAAAFLLRNPVTAPGLWNDIAVGLIVVTLASASGLLLRRRL